MDCPTLSLKTSLSEEMVKNWALPFEKTGINQLHLCHIVASQAAAYAALNVVTGFQVNPDYRLSVEQVEQWVAQVPITMSTEQLLQYVAKKGANWVVSQVCPLPD